MSISASQVKELRERTGLGMMECKKALTEAAGDIEAAITNLRKSSGLKAAKKAGRTAAEGLVAVHTDGGNGVMVEVNCETDFVARDDSFAAFTQQVLAAAAANPDAGVADLMQGDMDKARTELVQRIGENISLRRVVRIASGFVTSYVHTNNRIGVLVGLASANEALGRDLAMHIAASNPQARSPEEVPAAIINKEKELYAAQAAESGKPAQIIEKMVSGRINKLLAEISLTKQPFVKDTDLSIEDLLKKHGNEVTAYARYEVGEGVEKDTVDFATEVRQQAGL